jgi:prolyl 4-hydroxylase
LLSPLPTLVPLPSSRSHWDYFFHKEGTSNGGNRYSTVLMYLTETEDGGETKFPKIPAPHGVNAGFSECARHNLAVRPRKGDGEARGSNP